MSYENGWLKIETEPDEFSTEVEGRKLEFEFQKPIKSDHALKQALQRESVKYLKNAFKYIDQVLYPVNKFSKEWLINIQPYGYFGGLGAAMNVPQSWLETARENPNSSTPDLVQSLFIHEIFHNIFDDEAFPMFIEMIYMLEKQRFERIDEISIAYAERDNAEAKFKLTPAYVMGVEQIARWLDCPPQEVFDKLKATTVPDLKANFKKHCLPAIEAELAKP